MSARTTPVPDTQTREQRIEALMGMSVKGPFTVCADGNREWPLCSSAPFVDSCLSRMHRNSARPVVRGGSAANSTFLPDRQNAMARQPVD
jgi:hypothetical protein